MKFWKSNDQEDTLDNAPYIFPYIFELNKINLEWKREPVKINTIADTKLNMWSYCYFETSSNKIIGAINFWTYFKQVNSSLFYCYITSNKDDSKEKAYVKIYLLSTELLNAINNFELAAKEMKEKSFPFLFNTNVTELTIPMNLNLGINNFIFPDSYHALDEIILFSTKDDLYKNRTEEVYWADYVLIFLRPKKNEVEILFLDWFNKSGDDFGYVWPTRIARSKKNNKLYGQGIRMANFVLDPSGKQKINGEHKF